MTAANFATAVLGTVDAALTDSPVTFGVTEIDPAAPVNYQWLCRVYGNTPFHVRTDGQPATTGSYPVESLRDGILLSVQPGGAVSVVKADGANDGRVWLSRVKRL